MKHDIDTRIIAAKPDEHGNKKFVAETMKAIKKAQTHETFEGVIRRTNVTKKEHLYMKIKHLPKVALVALVIMAILSTGAVAYAAYHWLEPKITILNETKENDDKKREYSVNIENCGIVVGGTPIGNGVQGFEVLKDSKLTQAQIEKVLKDTCVYQQILEFSQKHWQSDTQRNVKKGESVVTYGNYDQRKYDIGKVISIDDSSLSIETTVYSELPDVKLGDTITPENVTSTFYPNGKKVISRYKLATSPEFWYHDAQITKNNIHTGDIISVVIRNHNMATSDNYMTDLMLGDTEVAGIIKTDIDTAYTQSLPFVGDPLKAGQVFKLVGCQGSGQYICLSTNSPTLHTEAIYADSRSREDVAPWEKIENADKYIRKDIPENPTGYFHTVEGRIAKINGNKFSLYSRGKVQKITVELPYDVLAAYNRSHTTQAQEGSFIQINYLQKPGENQTKIKPQDINRMSLIQYQLPNGSYVKY